MKTLSLEARIENSKKAISAYPDWVKNSSRFQGGGVIRDRQEFSKDDKRKVVKILGEID